MIDYNLQAPDFSPLWHIVTEKKNDRMRKEDQARQDKIDAMNATTTTLQQEKFRKEIELMSKDEKGRTALETYVGASVSVASALEPILMAGEGNLEPDESAIINLAQKVEGASQAMAGTSLGEAFAELQPMVANRNWSGIERELRDSLSQAGVIKPFLDEFQAGQEFSKSVRGTTEEEKPESERVMETQIRMNAEILMRQGVPEQEAWDRATRAITNTSGISVGADGQIISRDELNQTARLISAPANTTPSLPIPAEETMWEMAGEGTGGLSALKDVWSRSVGQVIPGAVDSDTAQARQGLQAQQTGIIRAFALNSRYTGQQMDLVKEEIRIAPEFWDDDILMRNRMVAIEKNMRNRESQLVSFINDTSVPERQKSEDRVLLREIMNFRVQLGVPSVTEAANLTIDAIDSMSDKELEQSVQWIGTGIRNLPEEVKDELIRRRSN